MDDFRARHRPDLAVRRLVASLTVLVMITASCGSDDPVSSPRSGDTGATAELDVVDIPSGIIGGDPDLDRSAMGWQALWLSRNQLIPLVLASGLGIPVESTAAVAADAAEMIAENPDDLITVPDNMIPLKAVYTAAAPDLVNDPSGFDLFDFAALRLDPMTFDESVIVRAQAETMLQETQWAHVFADPNFGLPADDFGAEQRFLGRLLLDLAVRQAHYSIDNLADLDGLHVDSTGAIDYTANWVMLHALSEISGLLSGSAGPMYSDAVEATNISAAAASLFLLMENRRPNGVVEAAAGIRALVDFSTTATDSDLASRALDRAGSLAELELSEFESDEPVELGAALAGIAAAKSAGVGGNLDADGVRLFTSLGTGFDPSRGVFTSRSDFSSNDVAWILGGLQGWSTWAPDGDRDAPSRMLLAFYDSVFSTSGLQLSAPSGKSGIMAADWETQLPSVSYYHPPETKSSSVTGKISVPAHGIAWNGSFWSVTDDHFMVADAMHLANELSWMSPLSASQAFPASD